MSDHSKIIELSFLLFELISHETNTFFVVLSHHRYKKLKFSLLKAQNLNSLKKFNDLKAPNCESSVSKTFGSVRLFEPDTIFSLEQLVGGIVSVSSLKLTRAV